MKSISLGKLNGHLFPNCFPCGGVLDIDDSGCRSPPGVAGSNILQRAAGGHRGSSTRQTMPLIRARFLQRCVSPSIKNRIPRLSFTHFCGMDAQGGCLETMEKKNLKLANVNMQCTYFVNPQMWLKNPHFTESSRTSLIETSPNKSYNPSIWNFKEPRKKLCIYFS